MPVHTLAKLEQEQKTAGFAQKGSRRITRRAGCESTKASNAKLHFEAICAPQELGEFIRAWSSEYRIGGNRHASRRHGVANLQHLVSREAEILQVLCGQEAVGYLSFYYDQRYGERTCHIDFVYVKQKYRSKGIGTRILKYACKCARQNDANQVVAWIAHKNSASKRLFEGAFFGPNQTQYKKEIHQ